jgi:hypothetical protein
MRFELRAAYVLGVAFPLLEVARRRTSFHPLPSYLDDFVIGALLLLAARSVTKGKPYGDAFLCAAWGALCGGLWGSFFGQLLSTEPTDVSGLPNGAVVAIKGVAYLVAIVATVLAIRRAAER